MPQQKHDLSFGFQWYKIPNTLLDNHSGYRVFADRFWKAMEWREEGLRSEWVLDVGFRASRFAEIALRAGVRIVLLIDLTR